MTTPASKTFAALIKSHNLAANAVLLSAWERSASDEALQALVSRRGKAEHAVVLDRWDQLPASQREIVLSGRDKLTGALRDAVLAENPRLFVIACDIIEQTTCYELISTLLTLAENPDHPHSEHATKLVLLLADRLSESLLKSNDELQRDPESLRSQVVDSLERSIVRFRNHQRAELVEAYVLMCKSTHGMLLSILNDPLHMCFRSVSQLLATGNHPAVISHLLELLQTEPAPGSVLGAICHRNDRPFLAELLTLHERNDNPLLGRNLKRLLSFAWLNSPSFRLSLFDEHDQPRLVKLLLATGVKKDELQKACEELLISGLPAGRVAACEALAPIHGSRVNQAIMQAAQDKSPDVQAAAARQLRQRHIPGTMPLLMQLLESPHDQVRSAAREGLAEFNFANFVQNYDDLTDDARRTSGNLMQQVDLEYVTKLVAELTAPKIKRRLRAIEIARLFGIVPRIEEELIAMLEDEDHLSRAAAADALRECPTAKVRDALQGTIGDRSGTVQNAARASLAAITNLGQGEYLAYSEAAR